MMEMRISLQRLDRVKKWLEVYSLLQEEGLTVVSRRNGDVGVGGLVLGGK